jgi:hypothetical protein
LALTVLALLTPAATVRAQEPARPDTVPTDTVPADAVSADSLIQVVPDSVREALGLQEPERRRVAAFPARSVDVGAGAYALYECDEDCIRSSTAVSLIDLLKEHVPGITPLRSSYFGGTHHVVDGPLAAASVRLYVDGRELPSLESGQSDLRRISLTYVERVRVYRRADGLLIDVSTRRHADPVAYARISGGSGNPNVQLLNAIFTNGLGGNFTVSGAFDLFDSSTGGLENNLFDFWGQLSWMPGTNRLGFQADYRSQSVTRTGADTVDFNRRDFVVRGRADLPLGLQAELFAGTSEWSVEGETATDVSHYGLDLRAQAERVNGALGLRLMDGPSHPSVEGTAQAGYELGDRLSLAAGFRLSSWDEFTLSELNAAASYSLELGVPILLRADAATGTRGIPRPWQGTADSVSFDALAGSARVSLGPYDLSGRLARQSAARVVRFGAAFDSLLTDGPETDLTTWEIGLSGPILPLGEMISGLNPLLVNGWWRRNQLPTDGSPLYVPENVIRGELLFQDDFFGGSLQLQLAGTVEHRAATLSAQSGATEPVALPAYTWFGGHLMIKIAEFRLFLQLANPNGIEAAELGEVPFPIQVTVFGVRWTFFN